MISKAHLDGQLQRIRFSMHGWGRSEVHELCHVLMSDEQIDECVNGFYEAGFALLVATGDRLLLVDKKPLNYLVVEDLRFDMINEFDYRNRWLIGAEIKVSTGMKTLHFSTWDQTRLRRLFGYVQFRMTEIKKLTQLHQEVQKQNLERMNQQLQVFLAIQHHQFQQQIQSARMVGQPSQLAAMPATLAQPPMRHVSPGEIGIAAMKRVVPVISAYTRLPLLSQRRRLPGSAFQGS